MISLAEILKILKSHTLSYGHCACKYSILHRRISFRLRVYEYLNTSCKVK
jgi:hypothetical protein